MIRMLIVGYCYAIRFERKLCEEVKLHLGPGGSVKDQDCITATRGYDIREGQVWFPTLDSQNHARVFGAVGTFGFASMTLKESHRVQEQYTVLEGGKLSADAKEVIDLVGAYDAVLETGHIDRAEILAVVDYAIGKRLKKILITHAEYAAPKLDIDTQVQSAKAGCFLEYCAGSCMPMQHMVIPEEIKAMIDAVTPERAVIATDSGQPFHARPPDQFRLFAQTLHELGVTEEAIKQMAIKNPAYLLGVAMENR